MYAPQLDLRQTRCLLARPLGALQLRVCSSLPAAQVAALERLVRQNMQSLYDANARRPEQRYDSAQKLAELQWEGHFWLLLDASDRVVAFAKVLTDWYVEIDGSEIRTAWILELQCAVPRRGFGSLLLQTLIEHYAEPLGLCYQLANAGVFRFYNKFGFTKFSEGDGIVELIRRKPDNLRSA